MNAHDTGYMDGLTDARNDRTPVHSQSAYRFPRLSTVQAQRDYNDGYDEAKHAYAESDRLNRQWVARQNAKGWIQL